jgi:hypothetical protein
MNVLFFLPPTTGSRGIDTMTEVILWGRELLRGGSDIGQDTDLSVLVSRDIWPFKFSLATTGAATNRFEHDCSLVLLCSGTFFPRMTRSDGPGCARAHQLAIPGNTVLPLSESPRSLLVYATYSTAPPGEGIDMQLVRNCRKWEFGTAQG